MELCITNIEWCVNDPGLTEIMIVDIDEHGMSPEEIRAFGKRAVEDLTGYDILSCRVLALMEIEDTADLEI
jgi:hypothetical protein